MMKIAKLILFFVGTSLITSTAWSQTGTIRGSVLDESNGAAIPGVKVQVEGLSKGAFSDLDGQFNITLPEGIYTLSLTYISYDTLRVSEVKVKVDEVFVLNELRIKPAGSVMDIDAVTVKAAMIRNTESALLTMKLRAPNMIDGISSANFRKIGDSDAASAMRRVPGVSLEGGKYVYIRGIGDRYNKTLLNGMEIPGLDPDRNSIQMDIFPTSIIDNMIVSKTFIAELPADFAGGVIDVELKSFPDKRKRSVFVSGGYNPNYHFRDDYLSYEGGKTDFLGFDDGTREIPAETNIPLFTEVVGNPDGEKADRYKEILSKFNPTLAAMRSKSYMDFGFGTSLGNQFQKEKVSLGYNFLLSYANSTEYYTGVEYGRYGLSSDPSVTDLETRELQTGDLGVSNVLISTMGEFAIKTQNSKFRLNLLHLQNGESKAGVFDYKNSDQGAEFNAFQHNLEYSQRSLSSASLSGEHRLDSSKWELKWTVASSLSKMDDPDIRFTRYEIRDNGQFSIGTESGFPERIWRELSELNHSGKMGLQRTFKLFGNQSELKFGGGHVFKERDFLIRNFALNVRNLELTGDPNELFAEENLWPHNDSPISGTTYEVPFYPNNPNQFTSNSNNSSAYLSFLVSPFKKVKAIFGLRSEYFVQKYTGQDQLGSIVMIDEKVIDDLGLFPSVNLVFGLTEKMNLRASYGKTIARPSFKEMSYAEISDPITGRVFIGGMFRDADDVAGIVYWDGKLTSTNIHNFDLRWELFHGRGQTISLSGFYKVFQNPIEMVQYATQSGAFQPRNVGDGTVLGGELEVRQSLGFIAERAEPFALVLNLTIAESSIQLSETELKSRRENAREGQEVLEYRDMAGQAPYVINGGFSYNGSEKGFAKGLEAGLYYNVQGPTLQFVGMVDRPDVYSVPFHSLNFTLNKSFGVDQNFQVGVKLSNILNQSRELVYHSYGSEEKFFSKMYIGTMYSAKLTYNF